MIRVLVIGKTGQLARALARQADGHLALRLDFVSRPVIDLSAPSRISAAIGNADFDVLVNAAAYTAVDAAEGEPALAMAVNGEAPGELARVAAKRDAAIIHVSTDYVFSGAHGPNTETDPAEPINLYGRSKLAGELAVAAANPHHLVVRTAWLHGSNGHNFVAAILGQMLKGLPLRVVDNQYGNPTNVDDFAHALLRAMALVAEGRAAPGTYHLAGAEPLSWFGFARAIAAASAEIGGPAASIAPIKSSEYRVKAVRPLDTRLDCRKAADQLGLAVPSLRARLAEVVAAQLQRLA